jgi:hypothetical protein
LRGVENALSLTEACTDVAGELLGIHEVPAGAVIVLPLSEPGSDQVNDFSFLASSPLALVQLYDKPQMISTYGSVAGYSDDMTDRHLASGAKVRFPSVERYVVAKQDLLDLIRVANGEGADGVEGVAKRVCVRPLVGGGEQAVDAVEKIKGTFIHLVDLEGIKHNGKWSYISSGEPWIVKS